MACGAVLEPWVSHVVRGGLGKNPVSLTPKAIRAVVTFQANGEHDGTPEQARIHRTVGTVASFATFHPDRSVLKHEGPAFVDMALETSLLIAKSLIHHSRTQSHTPGGSGRAMRIMAVRTLDNTLVHPMFERHRKLSPDRSMTGITEIGLLLCQKKLGRCRLVNRMAVTTDHVI